MALARAAAAKSSAEGLDVAVLLEALSDDAASCATSSSAASSSEDASAECTFGDDGDSSTGLNLLQLRGVKRQTDAAGASTSDPLAADSSAEEQEFLREADDIIEEAFKNVSGPGEYFQGTFKRDVTWQACTHVNWTEEAKVHHRTGTMEGHTPQLEAMMEELSLKKECSLQTGESLDGDTCQALWASTTANKNLQKRFSQGPRFANYLLVAWGKDPSWKAGAVGNIDYSVMPPRAELENPNGANGYGMCDIIRTVLTQSPNQMATGTCGYMATLAALSHKAPAKAMKMAVRLMWTGRATPVITPPCSYVFKQQPGLVPFKDPDGTWHPSGATTTEETMCAGNSVDCRRASGAPLQNAGLAFMWSQSLISSFYHEVTGSCVEDGVAKLNFPGIDRSTLSQIKGVQGQNLGSALWACNQVIDPTGQGCTFGINLNTCGPMGDDDCRLLKSYQFDDDQASQLLTTLNLGLMRGETNLLVAAKPVTDKYRPMKDFIDFYGKIAKEHNRTLTPKVFGLISLIVDSTMKTQGTEEMLDEACSANIAMLVIDSHPLKPLKGVQEDDSNPRPNPPFDMASNRKLRPTGKCNHAVYLMNCNKEANVYTIWSWGYKIYVTKELLLGQWKPRMDTTQAKLVRDPHKTFNTGIMCFSVLSDTISFANEDALGAQRANPFARHSA